MFNLIELRTNLELILNRNYDLNRLNLLSKLKFELKNFDVLIEKSGKDRYNAFFYENYRLVKAVVEINHIELVKRYEKFQKSLTTKKKKCLIT